MLVIAKRNFEFFIEKLRSEFGFFDLRDVNSPLPFKKYFFPEVQEIFKSDKKGKISVSKTPAKEFVLFGLSLTDLDAIAYLDEIMKKPNEDFFYYQKRNKAVIIGITDEDFDAAPSGDIIFQNVHVVGGQQDGNLYRVFTNTRKGKNIVLKNKDFFEEIDEMKIKVQPVGKSARDSDFLKTGKEENFTKSESPASLLDWSKSMRQLLLDSELLKDVVEWSRDNHPIWEELRTQCLGCGICTYVCPLCHCFSIEDKVGLDDKCSRCRKWDACTLPGFAKISGGHNFRPTIKERYYNWFYHKFVRAYVEYGKAQCVGCGNCKKYCPAKIDIQEVLKKILNSYQSSAISHQKKAES